MAKVLIEIDPVEDTDRVRTSISIASDEDNPAATENYLAVALAQWLNNHVEENQFEVIVKEFQQNIRKMH